MSDVLQAALTYAGRGWEVFPAKGKASYKSAKHSGGRKWGKTCDPVEIERDFKQWPRANIGLPCGPDSGFWVMELDTLAAHGVDGIAALAALTSIHGPLPETLRAVSPSGSIHYYWRWPLEFPIQNSTSKIGPGIDVRGQGGMVIAPPSIRDDGVYRWVNQLPIAAAPMWLIELAQGPTRPDKPDTAPALAKYTSGVGTSTRSEDNFAPPTLDEVRAMLAVIPNDGPGWDDWNRVLLALFAALGADGRALAHEWSSKNAKYDQRTTDERWDGIIGCPPDRITTATLVYLANEADPTWRDTPDIETPTEVELIPGHFILRLKGKVRVAYFGTEGTEEGVLGLMSLADFKTWFASVPKKTLDKFIAFSPRYDGTCLDVKGTIKGKLNLWQGWAVEPKQGDWHLMQAHILYVIANNHNEFYFYLRNWMAWLVQNPDKQAEVAVVLRGTKGAGKGAFVYMLQCLFKWAQRYHIRDKKHLVGAFNSHLAGCCLLFADEAYWPGDVAGEGALKGLVTERTIPIEPKGIDLLMVENHLHIIIAGNAEWVVPASDDERRYAVQDVSPHIRALSEPDRIAYFKALFDQIENGGAAAMLYELLNMDLKGWHPRQGIPATDALDKQKQATRQGVDALIEQLCNDGSLPFAHHERHNVALTSGVNHGGFWKCVRDNHPSLKHKTPQQLLAVLRRDWGVSSKGFKSGNYRGIEFPSLRELRQRFEIKHGRQEWLFADLKLWQSTHSYDDDSGLPIHRA